jgi:hypothetical protein
VLADTVVNERNRKEIQMTKWIAILPAAFLVTACAHDYAYQPAEHATGSIGGHLAADYQIPPEAPQGDVRLASFGLAELRPASGSSEDRPALHLRMVVSNNGSEPWTVDTREQKLDVQSAGSIPPAFSATHEGNAGLPLVTVGPGSKRIIDLFFPLPEGLQSASAIPEFDAIWNVHAGSQDVVERTPFDRLRIEPAYGPAIAPEYGYYGDWAGPFWYDPGYPWGFPRPWFGGAVMFRSPTWRHRR